MGSLKSLDDRGFGRVTIGKSLQVVLVEENP